MATDAAWLNGNNLEKEEIKKKKEKRDKNERRALTLTGLLMEGTYHNFHQDFLFGGFASTINWHSQPSYSP